MKLYRARIPTIARAVIERLCTEGDIEVDINEREEAQRDLEAIMDSYFKRDNEARDAAKDLLERKGLPYDQFGKLRKELAESRGLPMGDEVERFLARQFAENFMISRWIQEVFSEDKIVYKKVLEVIKANDVDDRKIEQEAKERIKNVAEGSVEYQDALARARREVLKRHGLA